jgi:RNA polymerase primary sigma factor
MKTSSRHRSSDSEFQIYLREINATPLLSREEECALADRVHDGDVLARDHMIRANLRLVVNLAQGYSGRGISLDDLVSEGNLGLMRAVEGFDSKVGIRFSTYASFWIKQSMRRAVINQGKTFRLPAYLITLLAKWRRAKAGLAEALGRDPLPDEIGAALRLSKKKLDIVVQAHRVHNLSAFVEEEEESSLDQMVVDERCKTAPDQLAEADELERIFDRLDQIDEREAEVVRMRFGLGNYAPMTLREIAEILDLTRERVRQLEKHAIRRLMGLDEFNVTSAGITGAAS